MSTLKKEFNLEIDSLSWMRKKIKNGHKSKVLIE